MIHDGEKSNTSLHPWHMSSSVYYLTVVRVNYIGNNPSYIPSININIYAAASVRSVTFHHYNDHHIP